MRCCDIDSVESTSHCQNREGKKFVKLLSENMKQARRFKEDLYKMKNPFNVLMLLDPRYAGTFYDNVTLSGTSVIPDELSLEYLPSSFYQELESFLMNSS